MKNYNDDKQHLADLERLKKFRLIDDIFFSKCLDGQTACVELILRILLDKQDLQVEEARTQVFMANLLKHSVQLDVLATDSQGRKYNIEIQRRDRGAGRKRARYNSSMLDASLLPKSIDYEDLPETYVIFITENDIFGKGLPLYSIDKFIIETGEIFGDGAHILYVNGAYRGDEPVGRLMYDLACTNPADMNYEVLAERVRFFKENKEGETVMCDILEDMRKETLKEANRESARRMLTAGKLSLADIAEYSGLTLEEVKQLQTEKSA